MLTQEFICLLMIAAITDAAKWGYVGDTGPVSWPELFPEACSGDSQSPIDIPSVDTVYNPNLRDFAIFYDPPAPGSKFFVHNNGHAVQVDTVGDNFYVSNGGLKNIYKTAQLHFHWGHKSHHGSEHTLDGKAAPIEMHIVNWNSDRFASIAEAATEPEGLAVLGIMFKVVREDNPVLEPIVRALLQVRDPDMKVRAEIPAVSMRKFLPPAPTRYYRYSGSLTTPGCFESVEWTVFHEMQTISRRQLQVFRQVLKPSHHHKKHHKRSAGHESRQVRAVLQELGIEENSLEQARFRRNLEEKMASDTVTAEKPPMANESHSSAHDAHPPTDPQPEPTTKPEPVPQDAQRHKTVKQASMERKVLVNNYRPVQPLNGRTVYRSFPFFGEPIPEYVVRYEVDVNDGKDKSSATAPVVSIVTVAISLLAYTVWH